MEKELARNLLLEFYQRQYRYLHRWFLQWFLFHCKIFCEKYPDQGYEVFMQSLNFPRNDLTAWRSPPGIIESGWEKRVWGYEAENGIIKYLSMFWVMLVSSSFGPWISVQWYPEVFVYLFAMRKMSTREFPGWAEKVSHFIHPNPDYIQMCNQVFQLNFLLGTNQRQYQFVSAILNHCFVTTGIAIHGRCLYNSGARLWAGCEKRKWEKAMAVEMLPSSNVNVDICVFVHLIPNVPLVFYDSPRWQIGSLIFFRKTTFSIFPALFLSWISHSTRLMGAPLVRQITLKSAVDNQQNDKQAIEGLLTS